MEPTQNTAQTCQGGRAIPLKGSRGVIGFIPPGAVDPNTHLIVLEVVLTFADGRTRSVPLRISQGEFEHQARVARPPRAVADLREWIVERARQQLVADQPDLRTALIVRSVISWVSGRPARREPFLL